MQGLQIAARIRSVYVADPVIVDIEIHGKKHEFRSIDKSSLLIMAAVVHDGGDLFDSYRSFYNQSEIVTPDIDSSNFVVIESTDCDDSWMKLFGSLTS